MTKFLLLAWLCIGAVACGQAVLTPPFGLKWGDSPGKLIEWAERHTLDVQITLPGHQPKLRILRIQRKKGLLPSSQARSLEARFLAGRLFEVGVHYGSPSDPRDLVERRFNEVKRQLTVEHGKLNANQQNRNIEDQFATRTQSFHREPVKGLFLLLAFTEVEDLLRKSREATFSLIYRNDNFRQQIEASLVSDKGKTSE